MIYADSSVIVKRYYQEPGSQRITESWARSDRVFTSRVAYAEVHAAFARKRRDGGISAAQLRAAGDAFESEWTAYDQILMDPGDRGVPDMPPRPARPIVSRVLYTLSWADWFSS